AESLCPSVGREAANRALAKDVSQLRRLVQAAITALRNAEIEDEQRANALAKGAAVSVPLTPPAGERPPGSGNPSPTGRAHATARQKFGRRDGRESGTENANIPAESNGALSSAGMDGTTVSFPAPEKGLGTSKS
ncbi:unnamed protein product, partial [Hapterophycus canaliculatus]